VGVFFLDFFCGGIVSCFSTETTVGANVEGGRVRKSDGVPEHKSHKQVYESHEERGDKESPKTCTHLKSCESLYTCPRAPFYGKTKGLLHSENTLQSREYS
jgi:hypothetical protein